MFGVPVLGLARGKLETKCSHLAWADTMHAQSLLGVFSVWLWIQASLPALAKAMGSLCPAANGFKIVLTAASGVHHSDGLWLVQWGST